MNDGNKRILASYLRGMVIAQDHIKQEDASVGKMIAVTLVALHFVARQMLEMEQKQIDSAVIGGYLTSFIKPAQMARDTNPTEAAAAMRNIADEIDDTASALEGADISEIVKSMINKNNKGNN